MKMTKRSHRMLSFNRALEAAHKERRFEREKESESWNTLQPL